MPSAIFQVTAISIYRSVAIILMSMTGVLILFLATSRLMVSSPFVKRFTLTTEMNASEGYSTAVHSVSDTGSVGVAVTDLRPSGKAEIDGVIFTVSAESGYIVAGSKIMVTGNRPAIMVKEI